MTTVGARAQELEELHRILCAEGSYDRENLAEYKGESGYG
jgi:exonuclease VII large subunit